MEMLPLQAGDVPDTEADVAELIAAVDNRPRVPVEEGLPIRRLVSPLLRHWDSMTSTFITPRLFKNQACAQLPAVDARLAPIALGAAAKCVSLVGGQDGNEQ